ncbi:MAG TPA: hypothetical protein VFA10_28285 [Ktedonobacteraceae bacterium]|nr:hypothetical protein [Ktedonobacteraceae bacterium]
MTDFLSRLAEQSSGRLIGIRPLIPPFFAPAPAQFEQAVSWSSLLTRPSTISPALTSNEVTVPPEQSESLTLFADLVPEHLRQVPLSLPLLRNQLSMQDIVRADNDEIVQDVVSEYKEIDNFEGSDLNISEGEEVNPERGHIHDVYGRKEIPIRHQTPRRSIDLVPDSGRHQLTPSINDQLSSRHSRSDGERAQSLPEQDSHSNPREELDATRGEDLLAPVIPTKSDSGISLSELPEDGYDLGDKRKMARMETQSIHPFHRPFPRSGAPDTGSQSALSDSSTGAPIPDNRNSQVDHSDESHFISIKQFTREQVPIDSVHNNPTLILHPQLLPLSGEPVSDSTAIQSRKQIDGIHDSRTTTTSSQPSPRFNDPIPEGHRAQVDPSANERHLSDPIPESQRAQSSSSTGMQSTADATPNDHMIRGRFYIEGVRRFGETRVPVHGHDTEIIPVPSTQQLHTIVPLIEDTAKKESATQQSTEVEPPPPVIHVRIGRVEVRATLSESKPTSKPARASRSGLTLSEYMQQRKEVWQ